MIETRDDVLTVILEKRAKETPDQVYLLFEGREITYKQLKDATDQMAYALIKWGIKRDSKAAIMMPNYPEYLHAWFGTFLVGSIMVPINTSLKGDGLSYIINHSDSELLIIDHIYLDQLNFILKDLENVKQIVVATHEADSDVELPEGAITFEEFLDVEPCDIPDLNLKYDDLCALVYTSGTTGLPKGVMLNHSAFAGGGFGGQDPKRSMGLMAAFVKGKCIYTCLPLFHSNAQIVTIVGALLSDGRVKLSRRFSASRLWDEIRESGSIMFNTLGAMIPIILKQPPKDNDSDNPVIFVLSAACPKECWDEFEKRFKVKLIEGYGTTEGGTLLNPPGGPKGSMGKPVPHNEVRVVDEDDNDVAPGEIGELISRPTDKKVKFIEYYKDPEATAAKTKGGWLRSGDFVYQDKDGFFWFVDRKKEALRRRGENITTLEVEMAINKHPKVMESAVIGIPSEMGEDEVMSCVVLKDGESLTPLDLTKFLEDRLAYFAIPRFIRFIDELPKTETQRTEKYRLKEDGVTEDTWDREKAGYKLKK